jgi:hypothetical protein
MKFFGRVIIMACWGTFWFVRNWIRMTLMPINRYPRLGSDVRWDLRASFE